METGRDWSEAAGSQEMLGLLEAGGSKEGFPSPDPHPQGLQRECSPAEGGK